MNFVLLWMISLVTLMIKTSHAGISYQSVSFIHHPQKIRPFHPIPRPNSHPGSHHPVHYPIANVNFFENNLPHSFGDELWPTSIFAEPVDFLDITLDTHLSHPGNHELEHGPGHDHDFINKLELPPDPYLLTGYRAKQAADYLYSHELFFKDIPHAKALLKLQEKRLANGLRPNRLGSISIRSPFNRDHAKRYSF